MPSAAVVRQQQLQQQQILLAGMARSSTISSDSNDGVDDDATAMSVGGRLSMAANTATIPNGSGGSSNTAATPFTPRQQQALMRLTGGPLSSSLSSSPPTSMHQQYQQIMMMQAHAQAAAQQQAQLQFRQQQQQQASFNMAGISAASYYSPYQQQYSFSTAGVPPHLQRGAPVAGLHHPSMGNPITTSMDNHMQHQLQLQLQLQLQRQQQQQHQQAQVQAQAHFQQQSQNINHTLYQNIPSAGNTQLPPGLRTPQYHFVGSEPLSNAYRIVTQEQIVELGGTPIPSNIPTPAPPSSAANFHASAADDGSASGSLPSSSSSPVKRHEHMASSNSNMQEDIGEQKTQDQSNLISASDPLFTYMSREITGSSDEAANSTVVTTEGQYASICPTPPPPQVSSGLSPASTSTARLDTSIHHQSDKTPPAHLEGDASRTGLKTLPSALSDNQEGTFESNVFASTSSTSTNAPLGLSSDTVTSQPNQQSSRLQEGAPSSSSATFSPPSQQSQSNQIGNQATGTSPTGTSSTSSRASLPSPPNSATPRAKQHQQSQKIALPKVNTALATASSISEKTHKRKISATRPNLTVDTSLGAATTSAQPKVKEQQQALPQTQSHPSQQQMQQEQHSQQVPNVLMQRAMPPTHYEIENQAQLHQQPMYAVHGPLPPVATPYNQASAPGYATLRTLQFNAALTLAFKEQDFSTIEQCVNEYFSDNARFKFTMSDENTNEINNEYLIPLCAIPRFYESMRRCGAQSIKLVLDNPKEWMLGPEPGKPSIVTEEGISGYIVHATHATLIVSYASGSTVFSRGSCRAIYHYQHRQQAPHQQQVIGNAPDGRLLVTDYSAPEAVLLLSQLEYDFVDSTEMINRTAITSKYETRGFRQSQQTASIGTRMRGELDAANEDTSRPTKRPKTEGHSGSENDTRLKASQSPSKPLPLKQAYDTSFREYSIPCPPVRETGLSDESMRVLEIGEAVDHLGELICFSFLNNMGPLEALEHYATLSVKGGFVPDPRIGDSGENAPRF